MRSELHGLTETQFYVWNTLERLQLQYPHVPAELDGYFDWCNTEYGKEINQEAIRKEEAFRKERLKKYFESPSKMSYVVCSYLGPRRSNFMQVPYDGLTEIPGDYYLEKHLQFLKEHKFDDTDLAIIVVNVDNRTEFKAAEKFVMDYKPLSCESELIVRKNMDGSYGAWHDVVIRLIEKRPDFRFAMLIEDDYIPTATTVLKTFRNRLIENDACYACQFWTNNSPGLSNGIIDLYKAGNIYKQYGKVFELCGGRDYKYIESNQVNFLNLLRTKYKVTQMYGYGIDVLLQSILVNNQKEFADKYNEGLLK